MISCSTSSNNCLLFVNISVFHPLLHVVSTSLNQYILLLYDGPTTLVTNYLNQTTYYKYFQGILYGGIERVESYPKGSLSPQPKFDQIREQLLFSDRSWPWQTPDPLNICHYCEFTSYKLPSVIKEKDSKYNFATLPALNI